MLFQPEAHESPVEEPWNAERVRTAITSIVADAERAFDDGWPTHPQDIEDDDDASTRFRTVYLGGAGVVDALAALRGGASSSQDGTTFRIWSGRSKAPPDFPDENPERSLCLGETGIRLVLQGSHQLRRISTG